MSAARGQRRRSTGWAKGRSREPDQAQARGNANSVFLAGGSSAIFTMCLPRCCAWSIHTRMGPLFANDFDVKAGCFSRQLGAIPGCSRAAQSFLIAVGQLQWIQSSTLWDHAASSAPPGLACLGSRTTNVAPLDASSSYWMLPPRRSTIAFVIDRPRPVPGSLLSPLV